MTNKIITKPVKFLNIKYFYFNLHKEKDLKNKNKKQQKRPL